MKLTGKVSIRKGSAEIMGRTVPRGSTSFYWKLTKNKGMKIFYALEKQATVSRKRVTQIHGHMKTLHKKGISVKPYGMTSVTLSLSINGKKVSVVAPAIKVRHLSKKGSKPKLVKFIEKVKRAARKHKYLNNGDSFKPVNIMWDKRVKDWRLVDVR